MKKSVILFLLFTSGINAQVVVNEILYAPISPNIEWFELYNKSTVPVNLQNWKWKDATTALRTITTQNLILDPSGYIVICQDSVSFRNQFPGMIRTVVQTTWSLLNNSGDNLIILNQANLRIDSLIFSSSWGGSSGGFSLERINPDAASTDAGNWGTSIDLRLATPGRQNSLTPKPFDLTLKSFTVKPLFPVEGETLALNFVIKNIGLNPAVNFSLNIYHDMNSDSIPLSSELINTQTYTSLNPYDSLIYKFSIADIDTGLKQYIARIIYPTDDDTLNNQLIRRTNVSPEGSGGGGIVINEIMYDPLTNQSEWIELYNATSQTINLKSWKYKETSTTINLSTADLFINPGDYFILAHDTTIYQTFGYLRTLQSNQHIKFSSGMSLTNTGEMIMITDSMNNIVDAVTYDPDWNNPNLSDTKGISIERLNPAFRSNDRSNWSSSAKLIGGTPGEKNSIYTANIPAASTVAVTPNPFSPDGDGFEDFALIKYKLNVSFAQMRVKIFDIKGRLIKTLANNEVTGSEGTIIFNGFDNDNRKMRVGIYILLIEAVDDRGGTVENVKAAIVIGAKL